MVGRNGPLLDCPAEGLGALPAKIMKIDLQMPGRKTAACKAVGLDAGLQKIVRKDVDLFGGRVIVGRSGRRGVLRTEG